MREIKNARCSVRCPYIERVRFIEIFFKRKYMRSLSGHWKLSVIEKCPYREVRLYLVYRAQIFRVTEIVILFHFLGNRRYYMAAREYEFYLRVLKVSLTGERNERVRYPFGTRR